MIDRGADTSFTPLGVLDEPIWHEERSLARVGYLVYAGSSGFEVAISEHVVERMMLLGLQAAPREWYGLLVGRVYEDDVGRHVVILGVVPDPEADAHTGSVRTSFDSELRTRMAARLLYPDGVSVGWVHGHIRYGARYSSTDFKNQATWTQPHSIGIVVDPFSDPRLGVYRGPEGELLEPVMPSAPLPVTLKPTGGNAAPRPEPMHASIGSFVRGVWPYRTTLVAALALVLASALFGRTGRLHEQAFRLERRVSDLEQARAAVPILQSVPVSSHDVEMCQDAVADMSNIEPMRTTP
jgi:proteasome lid subunit RPN8/RPN11